MKFNLIIFCLIFLVVSCREKTRFKRPDVISLTKGWKFLSKDSSDFKLAEYDDKNWKSINITRDWQSQGYDSLKGYAWYRIKLYIPSSLKNTFGKDSLNIFLGFVNERDQAYLNGNVLGENGNTLPLGSKMNDSTIFASTPSLFQQRSYVISSMDKRILWDRENVIAVRVFNLSANGGFMKSINFFGKSVNMLSPYLRMRAPDQNLSFDLSKFFTIKDNKRGLDTILRVTNSSSTFVYNGDLTVNVFNKKTKELILRFDKKDIRLSPNTSEKIPVFIPMNLDSLKVLCSFKENNYGIELNDSVDLPFILIK